MRFTIRDERDPDISVPWFSNHFGIAS
jgi:hypothetical protein